MPRLNSKDTPWVFVGLTIVAGVVISLLIGWFSLWLRPAAPGGTTDVFFRAAGGAMQLAGVGYVVLGLIGRGRKSEAPFSPRQLWAELRYLIGLDSRIVGANIDSTMRLGGPTLGAAVGLAPHPHATTEERIEALERFREQILKTVSTVQRELGQERQERISSLKAEQAQREQADDTMRTALRGVEVGRPHLEWAGVVWIVVGVVMATWAPELSRLSSWLRWTL
jgi:hypothetical protein